MTIATYKFTTIFITLFVRCLSDFIRMFCSSCLRLNPPQPTIRVGSNQYACWQALTTGFCFLFTVWHIKIPRNRFGRVKYCRTNVEYIKTTYRRRRRQKPCRYEPQYCLQMLLPCSTPLCCVRVCFAELYTYFSLEISSTSSLSDMILCIHTCPQAGKERLVNTYRIIYSTL